jgi:CBS domain-containing protein
MAARIVPDLVNNQTLTILSPDNCVRDAARHMAARNIGAVLVAVQGRLVGIITERDIAYRVVAKGLDPNATRLSAVMTPDPETLAPSDRPIEALALMRRLGFRHLPVVCDERIVGMVSIRDLYAAIQSDLVDDLRHSDRYLGEQNYGVA